MLRGSDQADEIRARAGNDLVFARAGNRRVSGNRDDDVVHGHEGNDDLFGGWGADRVFGEEGNDTLHALAQDGQPDLLVCGGGQDKAFVLRSERRLTRVVGCGHVVVVDTLTAADG